MAKGQAEVSGPLQETTEPHWLIRKECFIHGPA